MPVIHDLRNPTIVIAGAFNPFIFSPQWIANVLYEIPEGQEVNGMMITDVVAQTTRPYLNDIAILADIERLSLFIDIWDDEHLNLAESLVKRVCAALPHTPVQGMGINFRFSQADFDANIADLIEQNDVPSQLGAVTERTNMSTIEMGNGTRLNLRRTLNENEFDVRFNYHADFTNLSEIDAFVDGKLGESYNLAVSAMKLLYKCDFSEIVRLSAINR